MKLPPATFSQLSRLDGRVALITGGAGHLGFAAAEVLTELGAQVVLLDLDLPHTEARVAGLNGRGVALKVDLAVESEVRSVAPWVQGRFGRLDILVNCAALVGTSGLEGWAVPFDQQSAETWRRALEVNLTAPFVLAQTCTSLLRVAGTGSIINVGSIYGSLGPDWSLYDGTAMGNPAAYGASKGGLGQLTRWLATTLAPAVRVNSIVPGGIARGQDAAFTERYLRKVPMRRMATEDDFKGAVGFLASDLSTYVTGQELFVDGGFSSW